MNPFTKNMNDFTDNLYCSPADAQTIKRNVQLNLNFKFVVGNYTPWPADAPSYWRTMPFALCCFPIAPRVRIHVQTGENKKQVVSEGGAFFIPEAVPHYLINQSGGDVTSLWVHFRLTIFQTFNAFHFYDTPLTFKGVKASSVRNHLDTLVQLPRELDLAGSLQLQLTGMSLANLILSEASIKPERLTRFRHLNRFEPVFNRLESIPPGKQSPSSGELAEMVGLSQSRFLALFHEITGGSPTRFIEYKRYREACELLLTTSLSISKIAQTLRYTDAFHFCRRFKRNAGMSPRDFRKART